MKNKLTIIAILASISLTACQSNTTAVNNSAANTNANKATNQNTNQVNKTETNSTANDSKKETNSTSSVSASTPTAAYKAAYVARKNKDIKALKELMAKDMFEFFEILGEGKPDPIEAGLKEMCEQPQGDSDEVRNEKITGDKATLQYRNAKGEWETMDLVKEDGKWKLTIAKMEKDKKSK